MDETQIRQKANRRAAFITHLLVTLVSVPFLLNQWANSERWYLHNIFGNNGLLEGSFRETAGWNGIYGIIAAVLVGAFFAHLARFGYQRRVDADQSLNEKWQSMARAVRSRRALFTVHLGSALAFFMGVAAYVMDYRHYTVIQETDAFNNLITTVNRIAPPTLPSTLAALFLVLVIPHAVWLMYRELSDRTVTHALTQAEKQKNEVFASSEESVSEWQVGDDGELWEVSEQKQKRLAQE